MAVSHHAYGDPFDAEFDAEATRHGWQAWLDQALTPAAVSSS